MRLKKWIARQINIENEILIPFLTIGVLTILCFGAISLYSGYRLKLSSTEEMAQKLIDNISSEVDEECAYFNIEELKKKYAGLKNENIRIIGSDGELIHNGSAWINHEDNCQTLYTKENERVGWQISYIIHKKNFTVSVLEEQKYTILGAIAFLMIYLQAGIFLAYSLSAPIRHMSEKCQELENHSEENASYDFGLNRRDEIGQLAATFAQLLKNQEQYTKLSYTGKVAASLAHEIKNPLAGIRSGVQVLLKRSEKESDQMLCQSMLKEIDRMTDMITNLLHLSRRKARVIEQVSAVDICQEIGILYAKYDVCRVQLDLMDEPGWIYADAGEIKQIIHNLVSNSMKAVAAVENPQVCLKVYGISKEIIVEVVDNGKGMRQEEIDQAILPFYTQSINGLGLGLSIVNSLVKENGGVLAIESEPLHGTKVILRFNRGDTK